MVVSLLAGPALACGGLVAPNGAVSLLRTTTLAAYHDGVEHYVTSFEFAGTGGGEFGSIIPLPGVPTSVRRGGEWTLQRLILETQPQVAVPSTVAFGAETTASAQVLLQTKIDALEITILRGGGTAVGTWAKNHGFLLTPDAPELLDFYAARSPIFMAARFDAADARARGFHEGDGTPIHLTIPTANPWVPLRILTLGRPANDEIQADVYLLTDRRPAMLPAPVLAPVSSDGTAVSDAGLVLERSEPASGDLLSDLRSDRGMGWMPADAMWLTYLRVDAKAADLTYDLAVDATGAGRPSPVQAGLEAPGTHNGAPSAPIAIIVALSFLGLLVLAATSERRRVRGAF